MTICTILVLTYVVWINTTPDKIISVPDSCLVDWNMPVLVIKFVLKKALDKHVEL